MIEEHARFEMPIVVEVENCIVGFASLRVVLGQFYNAPHA